MAVFGTILITRFAAALEKNLPEEVRRLAAGSFGTLPAGFDNPQVFLSDAAAERLKGLLASFGAEGERLFAAFMDAVRESLTAGIGDLFTLATVLGAAGLVVVLLLREDPLRRTHLTLEEVELLAAEVVAGVTGGIAPHILTTLPLAPPGDGKMPSR